MKIEPGKYFEIAYNLYRVDDDGKEELVHQVTSEEPDRAIFGATVGFVEALDDAIEGKSAGDKFDFYAEPEKAFGPYSDDDIYTIPRENFEVDGKFDEEVFVPGAVIPLLTPDGYRIDGEVVRVTPTNVVLDLNHPLARNRVHYKGEVVLVREPTAEELNPKGGCCGGCGSQGGCGDAKSCNCGGGCC